jgi:hypothetical protein
MFSLQFESLVVELVEMMLKSPAEDDGRINKRARKLAKRVSLVLQLIKGHKLTM